MLKYFLSFIFLFFFSYVNANESLLTLKQQIDRLQREVNDLSKLVFTRSGNLDTNQKNIINDNSDLTAFDLRIYDLEKDIKKLNNNFEELIFKIDDLNNLFDNLNSEFLNFTVNLDNNNLNFPDKDLINENDDLLVEEKNSLGTLIISSEDLSEDSNEELSKIENEKTSIQISPKEQYQLAYDMIRNQKFDNAKVAFKEFIKTFRNHELTGSAHYWLGEMYLLSNEHKEAALILAEGYQNFPNSVKSPEMLYKLSDALILMNKKDEACSTINKFINEFPNHKLLKKTENKLDSLECSNLN